MGSHHLSLVQALVVEYQQPMEPDEWPVSMDVITAPEKQP